MRSQPKRPAAAIHKRRGQRREAGKARTTANSYCLRHYAVGYTGSNPFLLSLRGSDLWIVPVVFTSPGYGVVGEVGIVAIDAGTEEVVGATPPEEVRAAGARLAKENRVELDAAFQRARKV